MKNFVLSLLAIVGFIAFGMLILDNTQTAPEPAPIPVPAPKPDPVPAPLPDPVPAPEPVPMPPEEQTVYVVQKGDCLWRIARKQYGKGVLYKQIAEANGIKNPNRIYPGQKLSLVR